MPPCVLHEDEHLLVVNKPAGWNTHAPAAFAGEGIYDWLRHREPRWATLAIIHRLDKETSGVMVFAKTPLANRSLTEQFAQRTVRKKYLLLTDHEVPRKEFTVRTALVRVGSKYASRPVHAGAEVAETRFEIRNPKSEIRNPSAPKCLLACTELEASPQTGRTHQIRVHAAEKGFPILGDTLYGGTPWARMCLHAAELTFRHPASGEAVSFSAPADFAADPRLSLRAAFIEPAATNAFRIIHGASDGWPGWYVDRLGDFLLSQSESAMTEAQRTELARLVESFSARGAYHKILTRQVRQRSVAEASPQLVLGEAAPERFTVRENGVQFELSFAEGYSIGLFLDQRDNRRRFMTGHVAAGFELPIGGRKFSVEPETPDQTNHALAGGKPEIGNRQLEMLNVFAYTCGFSVCAALAGARTTSLDLSRKYLDWGRRNFALNGLDPAGHDFIYGDAFDWLRRLAKKGRAFDLIALDPPTFSQSKEHGPFRAEKDYGKLVGAALPLLRPGGVLFASTNAAGWKPEEFLACVQSSIQSAGRQVQQQHYAPQPPDFPISRAEPGFLKTVWLRIR